MIAIHYRVLFLMVVNFTNFTIIFHKTAKYILDLYYDFISEFDNHFVKFISTNLCT